MSKICFTINGKPIEADVDGSTRLLDFIRETLNLTGTKEGCSIGECGACTVIMNGKTVNACLVLAGQCDGAVITTVEGLAADQIGQTLQEAFVEHGGVQCGFCTPGVLLSAKALLDRTPEPTETQILDAMEGNICRCTGYKPIMNSIRAVIEQN